MSTQTDALIQTNERLEDALSLPTPADVAAVDGLGGGCGLGVSGKMGPSMARLALRAAEQVDRRCACGARRDLPDPPTPSSRPWA